MIPSLDNSCSWIDKENRIIPWRKRDLEIALLIALSFKHPPVFFRDKTKNPV